MVAVLSGGNIDPLLLLRVIEHGLAAAGPLPAAHRALRGPARVSWPRCSAEIAEQRANVVDVAHQRHDPRLRLGEVEVALSVETRGAGALRPR